MSILIAYASKSGNTEKCAKELAKFFPTASLVNLLKDTPDLNKYDTIILGSGIRMGMIHKKVKQLLLSSKEELKNKKYAFFLSNGFIDQTEGQLKQNLPEELLIHAICADSFGGELNLSNLKGMDKFITKMILKSQQGKDAPVPTIDRERMQHFAEKIKQLM